MCVRYVRFSISLTLRSLGDSASALQLPRVVYFVFIYWCLDSSGASLGM